jgi:hypothetical protein
MARKTEFELERSAGLQIAEAKIIGNAPEDKPYLSIRFVTGVGKTFVANLEGRDLERFAVNILKALESNKLKK